jgi:hypothetical protein
MPSFPVLPELEGFSIFKSSNSALVSQLKNRSVNFLAEQN